MLLTIDRKRDFMSLALKRLFIQMHIRARHILRVALHPALRTEMCLTNNKINKRVKICPSNIVIYTYKLLPRCVPFMNTSVVF